MNFEILINDNFCKYCDDSTLKGIDNKKVLSILNDFEDGKWRTDKFQNFIWNNIKETALNARERNALIGEGSIISRAVSKLRLIDDPNDKYNGKAGEIGEIILYGIMKHFYKALPIVPKIFYKQNKQDFAKGSDSIHIVIEDEENFSLWFGESKFYDSIENSRLQNIVNSVNESLKKEKLKKENSIITGLKDLEEFTEISLALRHKIISLLDEENSIDTIKPILNIPILILHECTITKNETDNSLNYKSEIIKFHKDRATKYFEKQINTCSSVHLYSKIKFHLILFPVPEKKQIEDKFLQIAQAHK
ncbi:TPA: DUF1837 domain-containing protein [Elizabethkingia anophelis]|uniref:HamA C-terminal domain-containing protein n=1 Tax=Elizabethkingia TaxID=308865 RepID=UPI001A33C855|nr:MULTISPECIES: DUF1837 domain-containing protein [Elizabethkingia]MCL1679720.1 DUF1837 domain-containing protein [Elizabethkingia miricola]MDC8028013.1 DUF1837 domain-containing protein [Elizabethkingia anophelis]MDV3493026.1 hypothetical protein [Elizabethkingia anophelis]HAT3992538.1 DUF1837 domain-containing protein [Elizabethkingia anophelis]HAT3996110.1 DUF1837 domain-containing protein [Elizabethkingia anophelis]